MDEALLALSARDSGLKGIVEAYGPPPPRTRPPGLKTLLKIMVQQQVSIASAEAIWCRLNGAVAPLSARRLLDVDQEALRSAGLSRQKARYVLALAEAVASRRVSFRRIERLDDEAAIAELTQVAGIGRWTAEIYLMGAHQRPDVFPAADLALMVAAQMLKGLPERPDVKAMYVLAEPWRPWRSMAARLLWHYYRHARRREATL